MDVGRVKVSVAVSPVDGRVKVSVAVGKVNSWEEEGSVIACDPVTTGNVYVSVCVSLLVGRVNCSYCEAVGSVLVPVGNVAVWVASGKMVV